MQLAVLEVLLLLLGLIPVNAQNVRPLSCNKTYVRLTPDTISAPYACRGEEVMFKCEVTNGSSLEWASEPDISRSLPLSFTGFDDEGQTRTRGSYKACLVSVARSPPNSNFSSVLTFTPSPSVNSVTVVCGDQLSSCCSSEKEHTFTITDRPEVTQGMLQHVVITGDENCPNVSVLILIGEIQDIAPLTYKLTVSSSDGCALQECPMLLSPGQRTLTLTLLNGVNYTATLEVSNGCGSNSTTVLIHPEVCKVDSTLGSTSDTYTCPGQQDLTAGILGGTISATTTLLLAITAVAVIIITLVVYQKWKSEKQKRKSLTDETLKEFQIDSEGDESFELTALDEREPLVTCTMTVLSKKEGTVQFTTQYNESLIKKIILAGDSEVSVKLVQANL